MIRSLPYLIFALVTCCFLLAPGVWWGDSLNAYIQTVTGVYGTAQPIFMALFLGITGAILPGTLIPFLVFILLFYGGLALFVFRFVRNSYLAAAAFLCIGFFPPFLANIGVVQTETLQLAVLSLFVAATLAFYSYTGKWRWLFFTGLVCLLTVFSVVRYDTPQVSLLLSYWLAYTFIRKHNRKVAGITILLFVFFKLASLYLDNTAKIEQSLRAEMRNSLMVTDIAAISAQSKINYVPDYCWQPYLPSSERTVEKIAYGQDHPLWRYAFYSYIYSIDPSLGLFCYNTRTHTADLFFTWVKVVFKHPFLFAKYHLRVFFYLVFNDFYNMGILSGLKDAYINRAALNVEKTEDVRSFLERHRSRFNYNEGKLYLAQDNVPISVAEEKELLKLVDSRRASDVSWMKWYSAVPLKTYTTVNPIAQKYMNPFFEWFRKWMRPFCFIFPYFLLLLTLLPLYRWIKPGYYRFTFFVLCGCGILHLLLRIFILTDPVYRFGMITILFSFFAVILLYCGKTQSMPE
ncbi:MAG TPA: hypothetical protein VK154_08665 [Chitinophagales bacterium]|nr:hypothetical protein [Chitinophagales bacterium]